MPNDQQSLKFNVCQPCHWFIILLMPLCFCFCNNKQTLFSKVSSSESHIDFSNTLEKKDHLSILYYLYYYNGGGVSIGDINNDGLPDIYFTANNTSKNKLYLNKGNFEFEDITDKAGVAGLSDWCTGSTMADVNGDGFLDIYVCTISNAHGLEGHNELYINNKNGTFTEQSKAYGLDFAGFSTQAAFFDYDHDGDLDCYLLNQSQKPHANIVDTSNRRRVDAMVGDRFYRNELVSNGSAARFTDVSAQVGIYQSNLGYGLGIAVADFNNDGWEDIYIGNDFHENDYYYLNTGNGKFTESGANHFGHYSRFSMGNDAADYNNDGQMDIITVDMLPPDEKVLKSYGSDENVDIYKLKLEKNGFQNQSSRNCLQTNTGNGARFSETGLIAGISATDWSWCPLFSDFDNDGNKDLFISSGIVKRPVDLDYIRFVSDLYAKKQYAKTDKYDDEALEQMPDGSSRPFMFRGDGATRFTDVSDDWGTADMHGYFNGAAYADLDNDGDVDVVINSLNAPAVLLKNNSAATNWISLSFEGTDSNKFAVGAKAYVFAKGRMQYQQLMLTRGFQSSSDSRLHFGLGDASMADSVIVVWPDQRFEVIKSVPARQSVKLSQKNASGKFIESNFFRADDNVLVADTTSSIPWKHSENDFIDFNTQYLIPHGESTRGPQIAVADINGDGSDDIYACAASGQPKALLLGSGSGHFQKGQPLPSADADILKEDVAAIFFNANGDRYPDLYIASGGNEYADGSPGLDDRLYLNDGKGHFTQVALPPMRVNKSCVVHADVDNDGDEDLFVGVLADAKAYGVPKTSYLLINDGHGQFSIAPKNIIDLDKIGLVTTATFSDVNKDGFADLIMAGEWMDVNVFTNQKGKFQRAVLPSSTGMWQTVYADDVDGDGNADLLLGNWGLNNKFYSGKNGPVRLYVSDFDRNGQTDQLLSYTFKGQEYPFLAKDEVERPLPLLKKHYLRYAEYSGVPMKDVFYGWIDTIKPLLCEKLASTIAYGDGKGGFELHDLPDEMQLAPLFAFEKIDSASGGKKYITGGNFYDVIPYEGRYDAQQPVVFSFGGRAVKLEDAQVPVRPGQLRDIQWANIRPGTRQLLIAMNNDSIISMRFQKD